MIMENGIMIITYFLRSTEHFIKYSTITGVLSVPEESTF